MLLLDIFEQVGFEEYAGKDDLSPRVFSATIAVPHWFIFETVWRSFTAWFIQFVICSSFIS